jgi:hypothetical protein
MSTCVETQTAGLHQLDNMTGLQKHPRTKAAASRYIVFHHACFFLNFLQDFENTMLSESNVFLFFTQPSFPDSPGYQSAFPGPSSTRLSGDFLSRAVSHALPRLYHVICPPVTGFHPKARRNMALCKYSAEQMELAPPSRETPRNYNGRSWLSRLSNHQDFHRGASHLSQHQAESRVDSSRPVLDRNVVCKSLPTH